ncbi:MAG: hypothetical protein WDO73_22205 [Ignavibacteriota bacterium]
MALPPLTWARDDPRWNWILVQPPRSAGDDGIEEPYFTCMEMLLARIDANVGRRGDTVLHYVAARSTLSESARVRFATMLLDHGARLDIRDDLLRSTPLGWACRWGAHGPGRAPAGARRGSRRARCRTLVHAARLGDQDGSRRNRGDVARAFSGGRPANSLRNGNVTGHIGE